MNETQATARIISDKYVLLRRCSQTMEIDAASSSGFFFCLSASPSSLSLSLLLSNSQAHIPACTLTHTHAEDLQKIVRMSLFKSQSCTQTFTQAWKSLVYRPDYDLRISEWTRSDASQWTPDLHSHLCPLSSQSALCPDVCSQLNTATQPQRLHIPSESKASHFHCALL